MNLSIKSGGLIIGNRPNGTLRLWIEGFSKDIPSLLLRSALYLRYRIRNKRDKSSI